MVRRVRRQVSQDPPSPDANNVTKRSRRSRKETTTSATKSSGKKRANGSTTAANAKPRKKRKTVADKREENKPLNEPFYVESGVEWQRSNIDFEELTALRRMWQLPAACHILWLLQQPLTLRFSNTLLEYEAALLQPQSSSILEDVFTKLLLKKSDRKALSEGLGLRYEWWNKQLRQHYLKMYDRLYLLLQKAKEPVPKSWMEEHDDSSADLSSAEEESVEDVELTDDEWMTLEILKSRLEPLGDECPLKHQSFADLTVELRCKILLNLCEAVIYDHSNTEFLRQMEEDDLRVEPLGRDRVGNRFYFFPQFYEERRLYRLTEGSHDWELWVKGDDAFRGMLEALQNMKGRKGKGEQELLDGLEAIVEQIETEREVEKREAEKAQKRAIIDAMPRKRSLRLQAKQLEEQETQKEVAQVEAQEQKHKAEDEKAEKEAQQDLSRAERAARRRMQDQVHLEDTLVTQEKDEQSTE